MRRSHAIVRRVTTLPCIAAMLLLATHVRGENANPLEISPPVVRYEYRLGINIEPHAQGLLVTAVDANSPANHLRTIPDNGSESRLERNDIITKVNGVAVKSAEEIHTALDNSDGAVRLAAIDVQSGQEKLWNVAPFKVVFTKNGFNQPPPHPRYPFLFAVIIANTNDPTIGEGAKHSLELLKSRLNSRINEPQLKMTVIEGDECNAANVVEKLALLPSTRLDSVFVYYLGHGAFDPRYAISDPSGGHFMDFPSKDVMRRTIWEYLHDAPAKLRIVVTDACNVEGEADPFKYRMETRSRIVRFKGATGLEWLLLGHHGELDLSAAARNEYAWYSNNSGGFFSQNWDKAADTAGKGNWNTMLTEVHTTTKAYYEQKRQTILQHPGNTPPSTIERMRNQPTMRTTTFRLALTRDNFSPVDPNLVRELETKYTVSVPFQ